MKWFLWTILSLTLLSCSGQGVAVGEHHWIPDQGWIHGEGWVSGNGHVNTLDRFTVQLQGSHINDFYRNNLNFNSNRIQISVSANTGVHSEGQIRIRLYSWDDALYEAKTIHVNGQLVYSESPILLFYPRKIEVEFIDFSGAVLLDIQPQ